jgi:hypothetical protein
VNAAADKTYDEAMATAWKAYCEALTAADAEQARQDGAAIGHIGLKAHDGYAPHSHEVRSDHLGVAGIQDGAA